ncbi:hypothetical protein THAOC_21465 [Thalassiosira oceanica]|uniref:Uncharacterized protein n=1 Tax=Thalassiosira oceanica TaxID=159749 RepID=K0RX98_THAOC|nr:hypothetical protein THAOC_21465 [Thalassiosira oceanica]|mmetsp:Transcript_18594/g.41410  ORF Transcript_18594/g.41410 Transcript_18594/m.41410 type:complete len:192 (+) Transcript_18594:85-660(+)|eukprot:EJK58408.1 hypothetical protein THAOC_21465 [Thalassiosira oceanica]
MVVYKVTLKLSKLSEPCIRRSSNPEDAARIAWNLLVDNGCTSGILSYHSGWVLRAWDSMVGEYETDPIVEHMVRGSPGTHPDDVEFKQSVVEKLTRDANNPRSAAIFARVNMPHTPEPEETHMIFEMTRGKDKLRVEPTEEELSVTQEFAPVLEEVVKKASNADELQELAGLLKDTLAGIERLKKKRSLQS